MADRATRKQTSTQRCTAIPKMPKEAKTTTTRKTRTKADTGKGKKKGTLPSLQAVLVSD